MGTRKQRRREDGPQSQGFTELEKVLRGYFKVPRRPPALSHIQQHLVHLPLLGTRPPAPRCATGGQRGKCVSDARDSSAERRGCARVYMTATPRAENEALKTTLRSPEAPKAAPTHLNVATWALRLANRWSTARNAFCACATSRMQALPRSRACSTLLTRCHLPSVMLRLCVACLGFRVAVA